MYRFTKERLLDLIPDIHTRESVHIAYYITSIDENVFEGLSHIKTLKISGTFRAGKLIPAKLFAGLENLEKLTIIGIGFESLTKDTFKLPKLKFLSLISTKIETFPEGIFDYLPNLTTLVIQHNEGMVLHKNIFDKLLNLEELILTNNYFTSIWRKTFSKLTKLKKLTLQNNLLTGISSKIFRLPNLEELDFSENGIKLNILPKKIFDRLPKLKSLALSSNHILTLNEGVFRNLPNLKILSFSNYCLTNILSGEAFNIPSVERLCLQSVKFDCFFDEIMKKLRNVKELMLIDCVLTNSGNLTEKTFSNLKNIEKLTIHRCTGMYTIEKNTFNLPTLTCLDLVQDSIEYISEDALQLPKLKLLYIVSNTSVNLTKKVFSNLPELKSFTLQGKLKNILSEGIFDHLQTLEALSIFKNIKSESNVLPKGIFDKLENLKCLRIRCGLESLSKEIFKYLVNLQTLDLKDNRLTHLPEEIFDNLINLEDLYLYSNPLSKPPRSLFKNLTKLKVLYIETDYANEAYKYVITSNIDIKKYKKNVENKICAVCREELEGKEVKIYYHLDENDEDSNCFMAYHIDCFADQAKFNLENNYDINVFCICKNFKLTHRTP